MDMAREIGAAQDESVRQAYPGRVYFLHLAPYSANQGQILAVASALTREGWDARIVCRASCRLASLAASLRLPAHLLPDDGKGLPMAWRFLRVIRAEEKKTAAPHLVHACDPAASRLVSLAWRLNKKLRMVHTRRVPDLETNRKMVRCYQIPRTTIITDSLAGNIALRLSGLEPHFLHTIACGIEPSVCPVREVRNDGRFVFAMTGELMPHRGHSQLFDALAFLEKILDLPHWEVRILGEGPFFSSLLAEARERKVDTRLAFLSGIDAAAELARCDALVLPAPDGESYLPLILQGWAARVPLIAVNRLDHAEILQDGVNCLFACAGDAEGLANQMARIANDAPLREKLTDGGYAALPRFSLRAMVAEHKKVYTAMLA